MKTVEPNFYLCATCKWEGIEKDLEFEITETCSGDDKIEICPNCGGMDIKLCFSSVNNAKKAP